MKAITLIAGLALVSSPSAFAVPQAPQAPIAAGPLNSTMKVIYAAHQCSINRLRIDTESSEQMGEAQLFLDEQPLPIAEGCLESWLTRNGKRLGLMPRWYKDDFTRDKPSLDRRGQ
jgi:hypothetical protein